MALTHVPIELWDSVISDLSTHELASFSLTCAHLHRLLRPVLYRTVILRSRHTSTTDTLALLAQDKKLAKCVVELTLERTRNYCRHPGIDPVAGPCLVNAEAFVNLTSLKRVTLRGSVFQNQSQINEFSQVVGANLEELRYIALVDNEFWPGDQMQGMECLKKLTWMEGYSVNSDNPTWSILTQSSPTLENLSLPNPVIADEKYLHLWNMHFPLLRSLSLGSWEPEAETANDRDFTDFILAHSATLDSIDLEYSNFDRLAMEFDSSSLTRLQRGSLPRLQSFRGNAQSLKIMAEVGMSCLSTTLQQLVVGPGMKESPTYEVEYMLDALLSGSRPSARQPLGTLKDLDFDISEWEEREREYVFEAIPRLALCCSTSLEIWRRPLPWTIGQISAAELGGLFSLFPKLRIVYVAAGTIGFNGGNEEEEYVKELAVHCPELQAVCVTDEAALPEKRTWWDVRRDSDSRNTALSITRRLGT